MAKDEMSIKEAEEEIIKESTKLEKPKPSDKGPGFKGYEQRKNVQYVITGKVPVKKPKSLRKDNDSEYFEKGEKATMSEDLELESIGAIKRQ